MVSKPETTTDTAAATTSPPSGGSTETTPEAPRYTEAQVEKIRNDALAKAGRDAKALDALRTKLEADRSAIETERTNWQRERDAAEETTLRDDPDAFKSLQARRSIERRETELRRREAEIATEKVALAEQAKELGSTVRTVIATQIATELGVNAETLLKYTDGSEEAMRELAQQLPKKNAKGPTFRPDSGRGGGVPSATLEQLNKVDTRGMTINQLREHGEKLDVALRAAR